MKLFFKILAVIILSIFSVFLKANTISAVSDSANVNLQIAPEDICNNNGACEASRGETIQNCSNDCTPAGGGGVGISLFLIEGIAIKDITSNSAKIVWQTTRDTWCTVFWGESADYQREIISGTAPKQSHSVKLGKLSAFTDYHFKVSCADLYNLKVESENQRFKTLYFHILENPSNFTAIPGDKQITLKWENPLSADFMGVRIVASDLFYPKSANEGIIIFDGYSASVIDKELINGKRYYYTAFSYDKFKNYSSGAIASAVPMGKAIGPEIPTAPIVPPELEEITIKDFDFYSEGQELILENEKTIEIENDKNVIAKVDYKKIPLKYSSIIFSFRAGDSIYSYLLRPDKEKTVYFSSFKSPEKAGAYPVEIIFFDKYNNSVKKLVAELSVFKKEIEKPAFPILLWLLLLLLILLLLLLFLLIKRRKEKKQ